jgi:hypothetical protein
LTQAIKAPPDPHLLISRQSHYTKESRLIMTGQSTTIDNYSNFRLTASQVKESTMTKLTRRSFLKQTSVGAATLGLLPNLTTVPHSPEAVAPESSATFIGPMVAHVSDVAKGEVALFVGAREIIFRDPQLVACLIKAAR